MFWFITIYEFIVFVLNGTGCIWAILKIAKVVRGVEFTGVLHAHVFIKFLLIQAFMTVILTVFLVMGQRIVRDYQGAARTVPYFISAMLFLLTVLFLTLL